MGTLRLGLLSGRLGTDTFVERVEAAYRATTHDDLASLTSDLPRRRRLLQSIVARLSQSPLPLEPPAMLEGECRVLGRNVACDYAIADPSVSSRHAELRLTSNGWLIRDLSSRNGTRVNGWLVKEQVLRAGDRIELGATTFVFRPSPSLSGASR